MAYFSRKKSSHSAYQGRNLSLKAFLWLAIGASFSFLLANADLVINPQISNSIAYIKQFFVTSDGTSNGSVGVVLQSSGVFATQYCDLSGSNCKTISQLSDISAQLAGLSSLYLTGGQVDTKITTFSGSLMTYLSGMYYDKTGISLQLAGLSSLYLTGGQVNSLAKTLTLNNCTNGQVPQYNTGTNAWVCANLSQGGLSQELDPLWLVASGNYYTKVQSDARYITGTTSDKNKWNYAYGWGDHRDQSYLTGGQVNGLAMTLGLDCADGQIAKVSGTTWICAADQLGGGVDLSSYATKTYVSNNYATTGSLNNYVTTSSLTSSLVDYAPITSLSTKVNLSQTGNWNYAYGWGDHRDKGYLTGGQVNGLAKTLGLDCTDGQIAKISGTTWTCAADQLGGGVDLSSYATKTYVSGNYATTGSLTAGLNTKVNLSETGDWNIAASQSHIHSNMESLDIIDQTFIDNWNIAYTNNHTHINKTDLDGITNIKLSHWDAAYTDKHTHTNKTDLDGIDSTKVSHWDSAYTDKHTHANKTVLDLIDATKINNWTTAYTFVNNANDSNTLVIDGVNNKVGVGTGTPIETFTVDGTGLFTQSLFAYAFLYNSDRRLKTNIELITDPLEKINQLNGYTFDWIRDGKHDIGVVAQEVEKVFPQAVITKTDGYKTVAYGNLVAPIIEAVKSLYAKYLDQQRQIDELKVQVAELKTIIGTSK